MYGEAPFGDPAYGAFGVREDFFGVDRKSTVLLFVCLVAMKKPHANNRSCPCGVSVVVTIAGSIGCVTAWDGIGSGSSSSNRSSPLILISMAMPLIQPSQTFAANYAKLPVDDLESRVRSRRSRCA